MIKKKAIITGAVLIPIGYFFIVKPLIINPILLSNNYAFTKATIISVEGSVNGGPDYNIIYNVNGKEYKGFFSKDIRYKTNIGDCYWFKYYPSDPSVGKIYIDKPCSETIPDN